MSHIPNKEQEKAFRVAVNALKKCRKLGLRVYAKQWSLVAYTKDADDYADKNDPQFNILGYGVVPHLSETCLTDSGADDYASYITQEDKNKFNPDDY